MIIIQAFVKRAMSANILNLRRTQSLGEEDGTDGALFGCHWRV